MCPSKIVNLYTSHKVILTPFIVPNCLPDRDILHILKIMKVFISIDMEGISGVASWRERQEVYSKHMEADLLAAIHGAFDGGAKEIVVADSHSTGMNINPEVLPKNVQLVRGYPRVYYMMQGLTSDFDVVFFIGYHAPAGFIHGQMDHTFSSYTIYEVRVNGEVFGEAELNALYASYLGVPVGLITGDRALFEFSRPKFPDSVEFVVTKEGLSRYAAKLYPLEQVRKEIRDKAKTAVMKKHELFNRSPDQDGNYEVEIDVIDTLKADFIAIMPGIERVSGRTLRYYAKNPAEVLRVVHSAAIMGAYTRFLVNS